MFDIVKSLLPLRDRFLAHRVQEGKALGWEVTEEQVQEWYEFCVLTIPLLGKLMKELELGGFGGPDGTMDDGEGKDPEVFAERQMTSSYKCLLRDPRALCWTNILNFLFSISPASQTLLDLPWAVSKGQMERRITSRGRKVSRQADALIYPPSQA